MPAGRCPSCGGGDRRLISPGFYECTSTVTDGVVPGNQPGNPGPAPRPLERICGNRYQEGAPMTAAPPQCWCHVFAVGSCASCGQMLCGDHGERDGAGHWVCVAHRVEREREAQAAESAALADLGPRAQAALEAYLAEANGSTQRLAALLRGVFPESCNRLGTAIGSRHRSNGAPGGGWDEIRVGPCWEFPVHSTRGLRVVIDEGGSCYVVAVHATGSPSPVFRLEHAMYQEVSQSLLDSARRSNSATWTKRAIAWLEEARETAGSVAAGGFGRPTGPAQNGSAADGDRRCVDGSCSQGGQRTFERRCSACGRLTQKAA